MIGQFLCAIGLHKGKLIRDTGGHRYYACFRCTKRYVENNDVQGGGYQPVNQRWLDGGKWDADKKHPPRRKSGGKKK